MYKVWSSSIKFLVRESLAPIHLLQLYTPLFTTFNPFSGYFFILWGPPVPHPAAHPPESPACVAEIRQRNKNVRRRSATLRHHAAMFGSAVTPRSDPFHNFCIYWPRLRLATIHTKSTHKIHIHLPTSPRSTPNYPWSVLLTVTGVKTHENAYMLV